MGAWSGSGMGCNQSAPATLESDAKYLEQYAYKQPPPEEYLEHAVQKEWDHELTCLFELWDMDKSGSLEVGEIGRVVAIYNDKDWDTWTEAQRSEYTVGFMKWYDKDSKPDNKLSKEELKLFMCTQACVDDPTEPDDAMGKLIQRMTDIIKGTRLDDLFKLWDADQSGYLDSTELNRVILQYNGKDWDLISEEERAANADDLMKQFDQEGGDQKLSLAEFKDYILFETVAEDAEHPEKAFNGVILKFTEILQTNKNTSK